MGSPGIGEMGCMLVDGAPVTSFTAGIQVENTRGESTAQSQSHEKAIQNSEENEMRLSCRDCYAAGMRAEMTRRACYAGRKGCDGDTDTHPC